MRTSLRNVLGSVFIGACGLPAVLLAAAPAAASDVGPQHSATPNITAEIGYSREQVRAGDQDTMTVSLVNHGPQSLDDHTSVHVTVTIPQDTEVAPDVVETISGNAPAGSSNAAPATRSVPLTRLFVRSAPGFFDVVVPAGSFGNSASFRTYAFTLRISPTVTQGAQLVGGGVAVALENYVGLSVAKSVVAPPPVVVAESPKPSSAPSTPRTSSPPGRTPATGGTSTWIRSVCPDNQHMSAKSGGSGCSATGLAATGTVSAWLLALAASALAAGAVLIGITHRSRRGSAR